MSEPVDREYLARRLNESLAMARNATDPAIASVHYGFAKQYESALANEPSATDAKARSARNDAIRTCSSVRA